ncbi:MAG: sigma 54-interacting transcriptional regulator [Lawsonibacter sp.]|jgi:transcriptional regulator with PAS, ATPase and Fis domain|nr:sigma 54-interacting transcriptional regulator [Lawsonibacter sp.]
MNDQVVILAVAENLARAFEAAQAQTNRSYPVYYANMDRAVEIAKRCITQGTNVFISRGRTASYLREKLNVPVISVKQSYFAYTMAIRRAQKHKGDGKVALIGFSDQFCYVVSKYKHIWDDGILLSRPLQWRFRTEEEFDQDLLEEIRRLKREGATAVVGGDLVCKLARALGLYAISAEPDHDSLLEALEEAEYIVRIAQEKENRIQTINTILNAVSEGILYLNEEGVVISFNQQAEKIFRLETDGRFQIQELIPNFDFKEFRQEQHNICGHIAEYQGHSLVINATVIATGNIFLGCVMSVQEAGQIQHLERNIRAKNAKNGLVSKGEFCDIQGDSAIMQQTIRMAKKIARSESTVLITGATGTGKEIFAQSIHNYSQRAQGPFVSINCAALTHSVLESELFGYAKGAFTGALSEGKMGIFEMAHGGTLFLDEISELPLDVQPKLLRVLQEREVMRIGGNRVIPVDVRLITASNKNLQQEVLKNNFRMDLYQRLNILELALPALDDRREDIPKLTQYFLNQLEGTRNITLAPEVYKFLEEAHWVGNVRQLRNAVERLTILPDTDRVELDDAHRILDSMLIFPVIAEKNGLQHDNTEQEKILGTLKKCGGNRTQAAERLGISTVTLWRRMKKYGLL